eukprot:comp10397_c0_seq1/m.12610 comp10397_c0_seq1/g.12610  ORF comp10397_c0_seq1/g.12610 comp10397_c0_seq1/m.12610 type:complete len:213 (+) comp10397_c0_seq1:135-773(+)
MISRTNTALSLSAGALKNIAKAQLPFLSVPKEQDWKTSTRRMIHPRQPNEWNSPSNYGWSSKLDFSHLTEKLPADHWARHWFESKLPAIVNNVSLSLAQKEKMARQMLQIAVRPGHAANLHARMNYLGVMLSAADKTEGGAPLFWDQRLWRRRRAVVSREVLDNEQKIEAHVADVAARSRKKRAAAAAAQGKASGGDKAADKPAAPAAAKKK